MRERLGERERERGERGRESRESECVGEREEEGERDRRAKTDCDTICRF